MHNITNLSRRDACGKSRGFRVAYLLPRVHSMREREKEKKETREKQSEKDMQFGAQRINIVFLLTVYIHTYIYIDAHICIHGIFNFSNRLAITRLYTRGGSTRKKEKKIRRTRNFFQTHPHRTNTHTHTHHTHTRH